MWSFVLPFFCSTICVVGTLAHSCPLCVVFHYMNMRQLIHMTVGRRWVSQFSPFENNGAVNIFVYAFWVDIYHAFLVGIFEGVGLLGCKAYTCCLALMKSFEVVQVYISTSYVNDVTTF